MARYDYDVLVIGAGSGGMAAARRCNDGGLKVGLIEPNAVGGTCVNAGCVPKKLLVHASRIADTFVEAPSMGWRGIRPGFDWHALRTGMRTEVDRLSNLHEERIRSSGIDIYGTRARIVGTNKVALDDWRELTARTIVVATGASPVRPPIPDADRACVSDDVFSWRALPERLAIVGGGYIAAEFASILARFGVEVAMFQSGERILEGFDAEIAGLVHEALTGASVRIHLDARVERIEWSDETAQIGLSTGKEGPFDAVLLAVGRRPATRHLGLETVGIETERGAIRTDELGRTYVPSIRAIGDVTGGMALTPVAVRQGRRLADDLLGRTPEHPLVRHVPTAAFTTPECGSVGMTEEDASRRGRAVKVRRTKFKSLVATMSGSDASVLLKAIVDARTGELVGMHFFGPHASEATQMGAMALAAGLTEAELHATMPLHPSIAEELIGLGEPHGPIEAPSEGAVLLDEAA